MANQSYYEVTVSVFSKILYHLWFVFCWNVPSLKWQHIYIHTYIYIT